ncbi:helix-turn-helix domain-containing protein [Paenibacillus sp. sptzw28]|uniref:helix-turn-helix domain-containing protein n=1 Tax=Paenibacillus sp. sptzw28 TaxID=715179 RepID=UPI001C6E1E15|nr:helix-turn-helix domain-containing protein [Paenibacillus sp. sptzw28]
MHSIGERIKHIRKTHDLNQVAFAQMIGISQGTLSDLESNKFNPSVETMIQLHHKFSIDMNWLILGRK